MAPTTTTSSIPAPAQDATESSTSFLDDRSTEPQFTLRAVLAGLVIGVLIAFSNTYFGLQTGWISGMAMPSALIGFAYFKGLRTLTGALGGVVARAGFGEGFSEVENVLVQTVAGSVGTMPLGCGFVGVIPALEFLLAKDEAPEGGLSLSLAKLVVWALGLCFFGVMFAVPLRKEVIIREKLRFPSGTATALMIGVLHGGEKTGVDGEVENAARRRKNRTGTRDEESQALMASSLTSTHETAPRDSAEEEHQDRELALKRDWKKQIRLLTTCFGISGVYTLISYFIPQIHNIPILGTHLSTVWLWSLNPSPAYIGQGIIMGPATTVHMLIGAVLGWAVLSPLAKAQGWASGDVKDWNTGSKGWIVWISLAIMLADAVVSLGWLVLRPTLKLAREYAPGLLEAVRAKGVVQSVKEMFNPAARGYSPVNLNEDSEPLIRNNLAKTTSRTSLLDSADDEEYDAPPSHQIGVKTTLLGLLLSLVFCVFAVQYAFTNILSIPLTLFALLLAALLGIMGVRALGETDLNPVSGISKLTQLFFALVTPPGSPNAVTINLLAGAISEAGALQAGDLLQDLKTGHLLGASPRAQFYGQLIGSAVGAVVSAAVYKLYTRVYTIPGGLFQIPTGFVWIFTARLVTGQGLPPRVPPFAAAFALLFALLTALRIYGTGRGARWVDFIPGGIAVAVGMYNTPSFTLARTAGGVLVWWWRVWKKKPETPMIILASGLILGEGLVSIVNLGLASAGVGHL